MSGHELILGGVKSGKTRYGMQRAMQGRQQIIYVATAQARDDEMRARIRRHRDDRPDDWLLIEEPIALSDVLKSHDSVEHCFIVDCLTLWMSNLLEQKDAVMDNQIDQFLNTLNQVDARVIMISNETSMGVVPLGSLTRRYCDAIGLLHQSAGQLCNRVTLMVAGLPIQVKGSEDA